MSPSRADTRLKSNSPTSPQFNPPIPTRTSEITSTSERFLIFVHVTLLLIDLHGGVDKEYDIGYTKSMQTVQFNPSDVARIFEVDVATVRRWIYKGALRTNRTPGGHHRISNEQLREFAEKSGLGLTGSYAVRRTAAMGGREMAAEYYGRITGVSRGETLPRLALSGKRASDILDSCIAPALRMVGDAWKEGKLPVHAEHMASFKAGRDVARLAELVDERERPAGTVVLACAPGESHVLPLEMADAAAKEAGWKRVFLGINVSFDELLKAVRAHAPDAVALSKSYSGNDAAETAKKIATLGVPVLFGGAGWTAGEKGRIIKSGGTFCGSYAEFERALADARKRPRKTNAKR